MTTKTQSLWISMPVIIRAVIGGVLIGMIAANVWPILLLKLGMPSAAVVELVFLGFYAWWAAGGGPPTRLKGCICNFGDSYAPGHGEAERTEIGAHSLQCRCPVDCVLIERRTCGGA
jgi:hypothetical protein